MVKFIGMALVLLSFSGAVMAETVCSDSSGKVRVVMVDYKGGVAPHPGQMLNDVQVFVNNNLVSESKYYLNQAPEVGPIAPNFDESTKKVLEESHQAAENIVIYTVLVALAPSRPQAGIAPELLTLPAPTFVICTQTVSLAP